VGCSRLGEAEEDKGLLRVREEGSGEGLWETKAPSMAKLQRVIPQYEGTLLIWRMDTHSRQRRHIFTYTCILRTCGRALLPFSPEKLLLILKMGIQG